MTTVTRAILVTGASSGIGAATCAALTAAGVGIAIHARKNMEGAQRIAQSVEQAGGVPMIVQCDLAEPNAAAQLVEAVGRHFGRLDVLVSNAGAGTISPLDDLRVDEWDQMVDVNIKGVLHGIGAALPVFRAQGTGHFITIASTAAFRIVPTMAVYAGTKFAVRAICEGLRQEAGDSLRVTTVSPGAIGTDFAEASTNPQVRTQITEMRDRIAIPPAAIAQAIAFAIEQPATVDVNEIVVRPTAQN